MSGATMSPSSPRLPSPPPPAEIPAGLNLSASGIPAESALYAVNATRRIRPGTKAADMAHGPPLVNLFELDSPFQLQEHLAALHWHYTEKGTKTVTKATAAHLANPPAGIDRTLWLYELCRFLIAQCNIFVVGFLFDNPPCSATTCPEMRASEWQYLCSVHESPKNCCAIDYTCHTLDWAANVLTDPKIFPSRMFVVSEPHTRSLANKNLVNVFRRVYRIFAHAWFLHRDVFWNVEHAHGIYMLFISVCDVFDVLPGDTYRLPPETQGLLPTSASLAVEGTSDRKVSGPITVIKQVVRQPQESQRLSEEPGRSASHVGMRGRGNPSIGSQVRTVPENEEDRNGNSDSNIPETTESIEFENDDNKSVLHNAEIISPESSDEELPSPSTIITKPQPESKISKPTFSSSSPEPENADFPVIVEAPAPASAVPESRIPTDLPSLPKTTSPNPGTSGIKPPPPSKLPKKASPKPPKAKLRAISPMSGPNATVPPPMHADSGDTVIATTDRENVVAKRDKKDGVVVEKEKKTEENEAESDEKTVILEDTEPSEDKKESDGEFEKVEKDEE